MSKHFASFTEANAAPYLATLDVFPCQTFAPHFPTEFTDKRGFVFTGKPDFYHAATNTFFETKFCELATPQSHGASENKLRAQYKWHIGDHTGLKYHEVSSALWNSNWRKDCLNYAWNHCLHKHLIIQKALGHENYVVLFPDTLINSRKPETMEAFQSYDKKGLFYLPISKLESYLTA